ncbi:hypothetical protein F1188_02570 [Roseospira marina]|uniref:Lipoprotein n=1 Tax=Roseospira marina TaxID=140057 RepID=A0A5M6IIG2_9PROT|nr:hypothetical protein [Roseospira marina]KAA5607659.1 hypothetical protein F1188_02570 [Roseospira marina]MBB4312139.1 hypothetical protein [Roseospira marina]MBB5085845.1 hypothetical protein [Roseospira marina]
MAVARSVSPRVPFRLTPLVLGLLPGLLAGCSGAFEQAEQRPCPPVRLEATTATLTAFRPGPGRDLTDVELEAELAGYRGECQYDDDDGTVTVDLALDITASLGPAATERTQTLRYFVALPRFYPNERGKQVFESTLAFPANMDRVRYVGEELSIEVPMDPDDSALDYPIYIGFQLTPEQVEFNRSQRQTRP